MGPAQAIINTSQINELLIKAKFFLIALKIIEYSDQTLFLCFFYFWAICAAKWQMIFYVLFCFSTKDESLFNLVLSCGADIGKTGWVKLDEEWRNLKPIEFAMICQSRSSQEQFWEKIVKTLTVHCLQQEQEKMEKKDISGDRIVTKKIEAEIVTVLLCT